MRLLAIGMACLLALSGCKAVKENPQDFKDLVTTNVRILARTGLKKLMDNNEDKVEDIKEKIAKARKVLAEKVVPLFENEEVTMAPVMTALNSDELDPLVVGSVEVAMNYVSTNLDLPSNPLEKLSPFTREMLKGVFEALVLAFDDVKDYVPQQ